MASFTTLTVLLLMIAVQERLAVIWCHKIQSKCHKLRYVYVRIVFDDWNYFIYVNCECIKDFDTKF